MNFTEFFSLHLSGGALAALPLSLAGGVVSAFNPCCLPMIPTVATLVAAHSVVNKIRGALIAALFVCGFSFMTALMGAVTVSLGVVFGQIGKLFSYLIALIPMLMALQLWGVIQIKIPMVKNKSYSGHGGAFLTGMVFALVIVPCSTPILASILAYAISQKSIVYGSVLLFSYGIGLGIPLIVMGSFLGFPGMLKKIGENRQKINFMTATALMGIGLYLIWKA